MVLFSSGGFLFRLFRVWFVLFCFGLFFVLFGLFLWVFALFCFWFFFHIEQFSRCPVGLLAGLWIMQEEQCGQCPGCCLAPCSEEYLLPTLCMHYSCKYMLLLCRAVLTPG